VFRGLQLLPEILREKNHPEFFWRVMPCYVDAQTYEQIERNAINLITHCVCYRNVLWIQRLLSWRLTLFQLMDLRWGIREQSHDDHTIIEFCMREIENCKRTSVGPTFVVSPSYVTYLISVSSVKMTNCQRRSYPPPRAAQWGPCEM